MDWLTELNGLGTIAAAAGVGAIIGFEREFSDKPAGLRTHMFVCAGSALLILLGDSIVNSFRDEGAEMISADPIRVIQSIVVGISFLGAGTIIHEGKDRVEGLTTAASIFLTAGLGMAVAVGRIPLAVAIAVGAVIVLSVVGAIERRFGRD